MHGNSPSYLSNLTYEFFNAEWSLLSREVNVNVIKKTLRKKIFSMSFVRLQKLYKS